MTKLQRRELYWTMYVTAMGISELMTAEEVRKSFFSSLREVSPNDIPWGLCNLIDFFVVKDIEEFPELMAFEPSGYYPCYWLPEGDWKPRAKILLKAWKATFKTDNPR